jgi:regulation of enolase protein 1 (concanavalin A-like superfamily)
MNIPRFLFLAFLVALVAPGVRPSARAASVSASPDTNQLYLVISNSSDAVFVTAYNTIPQISYQIQTNSDVTNPRGWAPWVTVLATSSVTPLSSFGLGYKEIYFRAVTATSSGAAVTSSTENSTYLGRLDVSTNSNKNSLSAELTAAGNQSDQTLPGWDRTFNPDGDCNFYVGKNAVVINVPGSRNPHDLAAEINRTNAPRVLQEVDGDFTIQVRTDGRFEPGDLSTLPGRTAYDGAAIIVTLDPRNVVTLARAVLQRPGQAPAYYANFEIRADGKLSRMGLTGDFRLPAKGPVYLRLQRQDSEIAGAVSLDGVEWHALGSKNLRSPWPAKLSTGITAISTSVSEFNPRFSELKISK